MVPAASFARSSRDRAPMIGSQDSAAGLSWEAALASASARPTLVMPYRAASWNRACAFAAPASR
jgi:hypothetical protein